MAVLLLWIMYAISVLFLLCFVYVCLLMPCVTCWERADPLALFVCPIVKLSLSRWYPWSGMVLDCIDSWSLPSYLLWYDFVDIDLTFKVTTAFCNFNIWLKMCMYMYMLSLEIIDGIQPVSLLDNKSRKHACRLNSWLGIFSLWKKTALINTAVTFK